MRTTRAPRRLAPLVLGPALATGALVGMASPALAAPSSEEALCSDYDTLAEAQAAVDAGEAGTTYLDPDGDGRACEEDELPREGVACPPVEVSDLFGLLPGECEVDGPADPDEREETAVPVGGVDAGAGGVAGPGDEAGRLTGGAALASLGAASAVLLRRRRS